MQPWAKHPGRSLPSAASWRGGTRVSAFPGPGSLRRWPPPSTIGVAFRGHATGRKAAMPSMALSCRPVRRMSTQGSHRLARVRPGSIVGPFRPGPPTHQASGSLRCTRRPTILNGPQPGLLGPVQASSTAAPRRGSLRVLIALPGHREGRTKSLSVTSLLAAGS